MILKFHVCEYFPHIIYVIAKFQTAKAKKDRNEIIPLSLSVS